MASESDSQFTFISVRVNRRDVVNLLASSDDGSIVGTTFYWSNGVVGQNNVAYAPIRVLGLPRKEVLVIGVEGEWTSGRNNGDHAELLEDTGVLDPGPNGPAGRGWIRDARVIDGTYYAVGMSRQAYMRDDHLVWHHIDADILSKEGETAGFNGVDGFSRKEVYAVGLGGEIWRYTGARWVQVPSPTNVQLNAVRCIGGHVYVVGGSGVVLRGRLDRFEIIAREGGEANLYAVEGFGGDVYVASLRSLYRLRDGSLDAVRTKLGEITTGSLSAGDGVLWSAGAKHLAWTDDGTKWTQVFT